MPALTRGGLFNWAIIPAPKWILQDVCDPQFWYIWTNLPFFFCLKSLVRLKMSWSRTFGLKDEGGENIARDSGDWHVVMSTSAFPFTTDRMDTSSRCVASAPLFCPGSKETRLKFFWKTFRFSLLWLSSIACNEKAGTLLRVWLSTLFLYALTYVCIQRYLRKEEHLHVTMIHVLSNNRQIIRLWG